MPYEDVITAHSVNTFVPLILIRELLPEMRGGGHVINVSSREGIFEASPKSPAKNGKHVHTNMSKAGLNMITETDPDAYYNDIPVDFGPTFFDVLNAMADDVGEMQYIIGLSMQDPSNDGNVVELAAAARSKLGSRLDAMLLGNEPDLYAGHGTRANYTIADYIPEIGEVLNDLENSQYGDIINETLIGGPTICCSW